MSVDARDIVGRYIYYFGVWEPNITAWLEEQLCGGDIFIDVGANIGYYSVLASQLVGHNGKVVAVEPQHLSFAILQHNLNINKCLNARCINVAAWNTDALIPIFTGPEIPEGRTSVIPSCAERCGFRESGQIVATPLSSIISAEELALVRVIKIDVEGSEWQVIAGLIDVLHQTRADLEIMIEVNLPALAHNGKTLDDLLVLFGKWGFAAYAIENSYLGEAYIFRDNPVRPRRILQAPADVELLDLVFSRKDKELL